MIIKQHVYVTDPLEFAKGCYDDCFNIFSNTNSVIDWIYCGQIDFKVDVDMQECVNLSLKALKEEEEKARTEYNAKMALLEQKKSELLCLVHEKG